MANTMKKISNFKFQIPNNFQNQNSKIGHSPRSGAGWSLIELLVVVAVFAIVALLTTQALVHSLRGSRKSEFIGRVRENLDFSLAVIERHLHSAQSIGCPNSETINYDDSEGVAASFTCVDIDGSGGDIGYIASSSARLTVDDVDVISCSFVCDPGEVGVPPSVTMSITAEDANALGAEGAQVTMDTKILLRIY
jgi:prepilin-type N-terminal cleavage/methylation domain-containing protein